MSETEPQSGEAGEAVELCDACGGLGETWEEWHGMPLVLQCAACLGTGECVMLDPGLSGPERVDLGRSDSR